MCIVLAPIYYIYIYIIKVRTQQQQKQAWYIQEVKDIRGVTENSTNTEVEKISSRRKGESHRDAFRPCSRVSSGGRTSWETNRKSRREEKDRFNSLTFPVRYGYWYL